MVESILREVCETASGPILLRSEGAKGRFRKGTTDSAVLFITFLAFSSLVESRLFTGGNPHGAT
eukprot:scaffold2830_cov123-Isochrysis_galbana.AAC.3